MNNYLNEKLDKLFFECEKHIERMDSASLKMSGFMPMNNQKFKNLTDDEIEHIDQFLFRFSKLQDAIGRRLFKTILIYLGEDDVESMSFIDILNRLEKLKIVENIDEWLILREIRNELSHEYDDDEETHKMINTIYEKRNELKKVFESVRNRKK